MRPHPASFFFHKGKQKRHDGLRNQREVAGEGIVSHYPSKGKPVRIREVTTHSRYSEKKIVERDFSTNCLSNALIFCRNSSAFGVSFSVVRSFALSHHSSMMPS